MTYKSTSKNINRTISYVAAVDKRQTVAHDEFILIGQYKFIKEEIKLSKENKRTSKREDILETAKILFSQKGYDAASMDEIALQTGVPKSLIYYHFKGKEELLKAIMQKFFREFEMLLRDVTKEGAGVEKRYFSFLETNRDFVRIILVESLKGNNENSSIFDIVKLLMQYESEISHNESLADYGNSHSRWVAEFFTSIIPCAMFICFKDMWCSHFDTNNKESVQDFLEAYRLTHGEYHKSLKD